MHQTIKFFFIGLILIQANFLRGETVQMNITETLKLNFSIFSEMMSQTELNETFNGTNKYRVFAPTNEALLKLSSNITHRLNKFENNDVLMKILQHHLVKCNQTCSPLNTTHVEHFTTLANEEINITKAGDIQTLINKVNITSENIDATDGIIYSIDGILRPKLDIIGTMIVEQKWEQSLTHLENFNLQVHLKGDGPITLFAPTNEAIDKFCKNFSSLCAGNNNDKLKDILKYHIFLNQTILTQVPMNLTMSNGKVATINKSSTGYQINNITMAEYPSPISKGKIFSIDEVLIPAEKSSDSATLIHSNGKLLTIFLSMTFLRLYQFK